MQVIKLIAATVECPNGSQTQLDNHLAIHVLRNPSGWPEETVRRVRLFAADLLEDYDQRRNDAAH